MEEKFKLDDSGALADVEVGEILRRARLHYGQSLNDIERILRIRGSQIEAIEKGDIGKLPGRVYAIGFVRTYAEYLGLDGDKVVHLFKAQYMDPQPRAVLTFPVPASETKVPPVWLAVVCIMTLSIMFVGWNVWKEGGTQLNVNAVEALPEEIKQRVAENVEPTASQPILAEKMGPMVENMGILKEPDHKGLILQMKTNSWVEIKDNEGKVIVSNVLKEGDQYFVPDSPGLMMSIGNAGGVELILHGKPLMPLGKEGDILRDIPLDVAYLEKLEFKPEEPASPETAVEPAAEGEAASTETAVETSPPQPASTASAPEVEVAKPAETLKTAPPKPSEPQLKPDRRPRQSRN